MVKHTQAKRKVSSKKKNKTKKEINALQNIQSRDSFIELHEYQITDEPIGIWNVPEEIEVEVEEIFNKITVAPAKVIPRIKELLKIYPNVPQLYNYLSVAYSLLGKHEEAEKIVAKSYKTNPGYLFSRLNYAEICMQKGEYDKVPEIFEGKFDIKALYPKRDTFHITEVVGFWGVVGLYFAGIGENDTAKIFYNNLKELVPEHPYTTKLKQHFLFSSVKNSFNKLLSPKKSVQKR